MLGNAWCAAASGTEGKELFFARAAACHPGAGPGDIPHLQEAAGGKWGEPLLLQG